ncbi:MAG: hypothetical protein IJL69_06785 [Oscillospiraceae bacterium]|nr:hypothetical protein [Oscillospiraceae bacterium]
MENETPEKKIVADEAVEQLESEFRARRRARRRRRAILTAALLLVLTAVTVLIVLFLVKYWDRLSPKEVSRYVDLRTPGTALTRIGGAADIVTGTNSVSGAYADGLAVITTTAVRYATVRGGDGYTEAAVLGSPAMSASGEYLLAYDRGGRSLLLFDRDGLLASAEAVGDVISASVSEKGTVSVVSEAEGYMSALSVYDAALRSVYRWYSTEVRCIAAAFDETSRQAGVSAVFTADGELCGRVLLFDVTAEGASHTVDLGVSAPSEIWACSGAFTVRTANGAAFLSSDGSLTALRTFAEPIRGFAPDGLGGLYLLLASDSLTEKYAVAHVDASREAPVRVGVSEDLIAIHAADGLLGVLTARGVRLYDASLAEKRIISTDPDIIDIRVLRGGSVVLFSRDGLTVV